MTRLFCSPGTHGADRPLLSEEEREDAFWEIYRLARTAIEHYTRAEELRRKRLRPDLTTEP